MLAPHELKNKTFQKGMRGYNTAEVDDYIAFLLEKYTEAYRENSELDRKLRIVVTKLDEIKDEEESIRTTLVNAQKAGEKIIHDANERAEIIIGAIRERCDEVISDFKKQLSEEKDEMWEIRTRVLEFKKTVYELYRTHIEELQGLSVDDIDDIVLPDDKKIVETIFSDVAQVIKKEIEEENKDASSQLEEAPKETVPPVVEVAQDDSTDDDGIDAFIRNFESAADDDK